MGYGRELWASPPEGAWSLSEKRPNTSAGHRLFPQGPLSRHHRWLASSCCQLGGHANTIWYSTDNMAKGCGAASRHFARATFGLSPWGSGRWPHHGSLSCLEGQASGAGQVILRENASGGCLTPARPAPTGLSYQESPAELEGVTFRTNPGRRTEARGLPGPFFPVDIFLTSLLLCPEASRHRLRAGEDS